MNYSLLLLAFSTLISGNISPNAGDSLAFEDPCKALSEAWENAVNLRKGAIVIMQYLDVQYPYIKSERKLKYGTKYAMQLDSLAVGKKLAENKNQIHDIINSFPYDENWFKRLNKKIQQDITPYDASIETSYKNDTVSSWDLVNNLREKSGTIQSFLKNEVEDCKFKHQNSKAPKPSDINYYDSLESEVFGLLTGMGVTYSGEDLNPVIKHIQKLGELIDEIKRFFLQQYNIHPDSRRVQERNRRKINDKV